MASRPSTADRRRAGLARALEYVDGHLQERLSATSLARVAAMSTFHFHRVFSAAVGLSVGEYVTRRRLRRAYALLVSGDEPVLEVALAAGYESAQALAKALRRELDASPTEIRAGTVRTWSDVLDVTAPTRVARSPGVIMIEPVRHALLPPGHRALTATARGMVNRTLERAARTAFGELYGALSRAGLLARTRTWMAFSPDDPSGPDDPDCRYVAAVVFDSPLDAAASALAPPSLELSGSLEWWRIEPGPAAVFLHRGPYSRLHETWSAIYADWYPSSPHALRDAPPFEVMLNDPERTAPQDLLTEIWIPLAK